MRRGSAITLIIALAVTAMYGGIRMSTAAWTDQTVNPGNSVATLTIAAPGAPTSALNPDCTNILITWTAAANADDYRVEKNVSGGGWVVELASSGGALTHNDVTIYANASLDYRVVGLRAGTSWESAPSAVTASLTCGITPVTDLAAVNPCTNTDLTWTAPPGTNRFDVRRRINGGAWAVLVNNQTGTTYTDTTLFTAGDTVEYQVRSGVGAANGSWGNIAMVASWDSFRITGIAVTNGGTAGTVGPGDTIFVQMSKDTSWTRITDNRLHVRRRNETRVPRGAGGRRVFRWLPGFNFMSGTGNVTGTNTFGLNTYVWTATGAGPNQTGPINTVPVVVHNGPRCLADTTVRPDTATPVTATGAF